MDAQASDLYLGGMLGANGVNGAAGKVTFINCTNTATVNSSTTASKKMFFGGMLARNELTGSTSESYDTVTADGCTVNVTCTATGAQAGVGGIVGNTVGGSATAPVGKYDVKNCTVNMSIGNMNDASSEAAGIALYAYGDVDIANCTVKGSINLTNCVTAAGVVAYAYGDTTVTNCYTDVEIKNTGDAPLSMGGITGAVMGDLSVSNCVATGDIMLTDATDAKFYIGGIVGNSSILKQNDGTKRTINNCIYDGNISVTSTSTATQANDMAVGGIAGRYLNGVQIHNSEMYGTVTVNYGANVSHRSGLFVGAFGFALMGTGQKSIITNCLCVFPETTENPVEFETSGNTTGTTLRAIGAANMNSDNGIVEAGSIKIIKKTSSDIDMNLEGVQWTNPVDFDHDNDASTPAVKANDIRFVATLGDADVTESESVLSKYSSVGFVITAVYGTSIYDFSQDLTHVYTSVKADGDDVTAAQLGGDYVVALTGKNVPAAATDTVTFYVTPKLTTADGTGVVYGATTTLVFVGGVYRTLQS